MHIRDLYFILHKQIVGIAATQATKINLGSKETPTFELEFECH
jgi:hypothetical protein